MLTVIRKRFCKSGFQKRGTNQQALKGDLTHLEHLLNDGIKTKSGVVRTQVAIVFFAKGPSHGPCRKIAPERARTKVAEYCSIRYAELNSRNVPLLAGNMVAGSKIRGSGRVVGNPYLIALRQSCPSSGRRRQRASKSGLSMFGLLDYRGWPRRRLHSPRAERMKVKPPSPPSAQSVQTKKKPPVDLAISP